MNAHDPKCIHAQIYLRDIILALYPTYTALTN